MTGVQPTRRLPPSQIYGCDYGGTKSILIGVDSSGSIQASVAPSGTQDVRAIGTSTVVLAGTGSTVQVVGIFAGTQDVRTLNTSTVQIQAGTIDVRSITSSTVQVGGVAGTVDVRTVTGSTVQIGSQPTMAGTQDVSLGNSTIDIRAISSSTVQATYHKSTAATGGTIIQIGTTAATILAQNTSRQYAMLGLRNNEVMFGFGRVPSTLDYDFRLRQDDVYEINPLNQWQGNIQAIANAAAGGTLELVEW